MYSFVVTVKITIQLTPFYHQLKWRYSQPHCSSIFSKTLSNQFQTNKIEKYRLCAPPLGELHAINHSVRRIVLKPTSKTYHTLKKALHISSTPSYISLTHAISSLEKRRHSKIHHEKDIARKHNHSVNCVTWTWPFGNLPFSRSMPPYCPSSQTLHKNLQK